jgi:hypothetical protein
MRPLITALVLTAATAAFADITLVNEVTTGGKKRLVTLSVRGQKTFMSLEEEGKTPPTMLRDGTTRTMFIIDHAAKTVMKTVEPNEEELKQRQELFKKQMEQQLARMPPEQRKKLEERMFPTEGQGAADVTYEKEKSPPRKVNGFTCEDYVIKREGQVAGGGCFAAWKEFGLTAQEYQTLFKTALPKGAFGGPGSNLAGEHLAPGVAVYRKSVDPSGQVTSETTLKSLSKKALPAEKFEVPKDYTAKALPPMPPAPPKK